MPDLIDELVGIAPGSPLDAVRARRPGAREHSERSFQVLFHPEEPGDVSPAERHALGLYVALLHRDDALAARFAEGLGDAALEGAVRGAAAQTLAEGPTGSYPPGPLSVEDTPAPGFALEGATRAALGPRLAAGFAHAHYLVFHPRDARPDRFPPLFEAGWSADGIVTLSQIVSFLAYQIRAVAGLRALAAA